MMMDSDGRTRSSPISTSSPRGSTPPPPSSSSSSTSSAFRRLPALPGLGKGRSPFKRSTAPSPASNPSPASPSSQPTNSNIPPSTSASSTTSAASGSASKTQHRPPHIFGTSSPSTNGRVDSSSASGSISSFLGRRSTHAQAGNDHMSSLLTGRRGSNDRSAGSTSPSGSRYQSRSTSLARSRSRSSSIDGAQSGVISGSESRKHPDEGVEEVVDIGFPESGTFTALGPVVGHRESSVVDDGRTPTKEAVNPFGFSFPTNGLLRESDKEAIDTSIALTPPTPTNAGRRVSGRYSAGSSHVENDSAKNNINVSPTMSATSPAATVRAHFPAVSVEDEGVSSPVKSSAEYKMAARLENRRSQFYYVAAEASTREVENMAASSNLPPPSVSQAPRSSFSPAMPIPKISTRDISNHRARSASSSAPHTAVDYPNSSRFPVPLESQSSPSIPGNTDDAGVQRRISSRNRLRRRASTLGMTNPARVHRSDGLAGAADTLDATASSSEEGPSDDPPRRVIPVRRSSRSLRDETDGARTDSDGGLPRPDYARHASDLSDPMATSSKLTKDKVLSKTTADGDHDREEWRQRRKASAARDVNERPSMETSGRVGSPRKEPTKLPRHSRRGVGREKEPNSPPSAREPVEMSLPNAKVVRAPKSAMYFYQMPFHGMPPPQPLRAHTATLVGQKIYVIGGTDIRRCWEGVAKFDTETLGWSLVKASGEKLPKLRAHSTTLVGKLLYVFGGGDGAIYSNEVWAFDTTTNKWCKPNILTPRSHWPPTRRAHSTVLYLHHLVVFGGGNGQAALNDVWALDVSDPQSLSWSKWDAKGDVPPSKGYHTANLVGHKMLIYGGSDGHASFSDVHVLDLKTMVWTLVKTEVNHSRLSHTATQVGSYLFVIGGHDGQKYAQEMLLLNLVTLAWEKKAVFGQFPSGRGYHTAVTHDSRLFVMGGYNGTTVFDDIWCLELAASAYLPQVTAFEIDETYQNDDVDDHVSS